MRNDFLEPPGIIGSDKFDHEPNSWLIERSQQMEAESTLRSAA
jgi:hypothetical protein